MADCPDLLRFKCTSHLQHDGRRSVDFVAREKRALRQNQMNASGLYAINAADRSSQFTFQRAQMIYVLHERRRAEGIGLVENFVSDTAAFWQPGFRQLHAQSR